MVKVCVGWFPERKGFYMDERLKLQVDILLKNIKDDWDFTIIISGSGEVRVGKSVLAMQIACYWCYMIEKLYKIKIPFSIKGNMVFEGKKLIEIGNKLGKEHPYSPLIYDEAGADLEGRKSMQSITQDVLDFYRECGQYNLLNILVLPEFFDLPKGIAMSRSIFLLDVFYKATDQCIFQRGFYNFFSKRQKKYLYLKGKRELDYHAANPDWGKIAGRFFNFYPIDEKGYRKEKQEALSRRGTRKRNKFQIQRDACWYLLNKEFQMTQSEIGKRMEQMTGEFVPQQSISDGLLHYAVEFD